MTTENILLSCAMKIAINTLKSHPGKYSNVISTVPGGDKRVFLTNNNTKKPKSIEYLWDDSAEYHTFRISIGSSSITIIYDNDPIAAITTINNGFVEEKTMEVKEAIEKVRSLLYKKTLGEIKVTDIERTLRVSR